MALFSAAGAPDLFAGPFAKMIPPAYHQKILNNDFAVTSSTRLQVEAYRMETQHMIKVKYWVQDHLNALIFSVAVTTFPWFHPNDSPTITNRLTTFNSTCETYDILDTAFYSLQNTTKDTDEWVTTSSATKVKPDVTLLLRVPGVTYCVGLRPSRKRALSQPEYERGSADHRRSPSADDHPPISPNSTPSPTKRLRPQRSTETLRSDNDHDSDLELQNEHPGTPTARRVLQILNAVLSSDSAHPSSSTSFLGPDTPRGRRSAFPLAFASDMDAGFRQISDLPADWSAQRHFEDVFGVLGLSFVASTYSENLKAWLNSDPERNIVIDWDYVVAVDQSEAKERAVENLFRQFFKEGLVAMPLKLVFPPVGSSPPLSPVPLTPTSDMEVELPAIPAVVEENKDQTGVVEEEKGEMKVLLLELTDNEQLYAAMLHRKCPIGQTRVLADRRAEPFDRAWVIQTLVKDCTIDPGNPVTRFALGAEVPLDGYGPKGTTACLFAESAHIVKALVGTPFCPSAPWDMFYCLPGYPSVLGPIARRHSDIEGVQMDKSKVGLRQVPVLGPENALRLMVVFKHPLDTDRKVPCIEASDSAEHICGILPYSEKIKDEEDVKPDLGKKAATENDEKKELKIQFLIEYFDKVRPGVRALRESKARAKLGGSPFQTAKWIEEIAYLKKNHIKMTTIPGAPKELGKGKISDEVWEKVMGRGSSYIKSALLVQTYVETCKNEVDVAKYLLQSEPAKVSLKDFVQAISAMAWVPYDGP
ncbi:hypothetical protein C8R47DRAFT_1326999 [Mycena vitilis]|nr:hypothetical protein C8R47DRAFT_1326999 [Mycena vitilis]